MVEERKVKFLLSRGDFYHQRGYWVIANLLRDAGLEVILGGIQTIEEIVESAIQEDVSVIGYRIMDGSPKVILPKLLAKMEERGIGNVPVVVGGIIPRKDEEIIKELGVKEVFHPFTPQDVIVERCKTIGNEYLKVSKG